jgi:dipeptidyl aminopeptidase/acylaminoacyl peptidase
MRNAIIFGLLALFCWSRALAAIAKTVPLTEIAPIMAAPLMKIPADNLPATNLVPVPLSAPAQLQSAVGAASAEPAKQATAMSAVFDAQASKDEASVAIPDQLVTDGMPGIPASLAQAAAPYLEMRAASFASWHPAKRQMLIATRFADSAQLHIIKRPGGARTQMTFFKEPVAGGAFQPTHGRYLLYSQDNGGGEFYQLYRFDPKTGRSTLLTDGKSRNSGGGFSPNGDLYAYTSTRRNGRDNDIYVIDPENPASNRLVAQVDSGGWGVDGWSPDGKTLIVGKYVSINESELYLLNMATGEKKRLAPGKGERVSYGATEFSRDGKWIYALSTRDSEFHRLVRIDAKTGVEKPFSKDGSWGAEDFALSKDGRHIAIVTNEDGASVLRVLDAKTGRETLRPKLPLGVVGGLRWHLNGRDLGFSLSSAKTSGDAYSLDVRNGKVTRWTFSETGGLDAKQFQEPELVRIKSFDGLVVSGFLYRPDPKKFPGKRPVVVNIHGGPEGQSRPGFQGRMNYYVNELGLAVLFPNVRGSEGYGRTFLDLDNGFKREDSVKDIGAFLDWIKMDPALDGDLIAVMGGSYGGYMTLASLVHYSDKIVGGVDVVGISNFVTFLENTQEYRRDLRRAEYGDERDPEMRAFLQRISPANNVDKITKPLFVVQGANDPRVPVTEAEQIVAAVRAAGKEAWYLLGRDEGHGFAKKKNADYYFLAVITFLSALLLGKRAAD